MTRRYFGPGPRAGGDVWTAGLMGIGGGGALGGGGGAGVVGSPTPTPGAVPTATAVAAEGRVGGVEAAGGALVWPPVEWLIEHSFGPLGAVDVALAVYECETAEGSAWVGALGELGPFQLQPDGGAGERFAAAGWDLLDPRESVMAAALIVAEEGWWPWKA